jgi:hypothetical protein
MNKKEKNIKQALSGLQALLIRETKPATREQLEGQIKALEGQLNPEPLSDGQQIYLATPQSNAYWLMDVYEAGYNQGLWQSDAEMWAAVSYCQEPTQGNHNRFMDALGLSDNQEVMAA